MAVSLTEHFDGSNGTALSTANTAYTNGLTNASCTTTFDTSTSAAGTASAKIAQTATTGTVSMKPPTFTATNVRYKRWCLRLNTLPTGNTYIASVISGGTTIGRVAVNSAGKIFIQDGTTTISTGTVAMSASTWYRIEWDLNGTSSVVRVYAGPSSLTLVDTITATVAGNTFTQDNDGLIASANSSNLTIWWDEAQYDTATQPGPVPITASSSGSLGFGGSDTAQGNASTTDGLVFGGSSTAQGTSSTAGAVGFSGTSTGQAVASSSGGLGFGSSDTAQGRGTATGSFAVTGAATGQGRGSSTGALAFTGTSSSTNAMSSTGSVGFSGLSTPYVAASATGSLSFGGSGTARGVGTASGTLALTGSGSPVVLAVASGALGFTGASDGQPAATVAWSTGSLGFTGTSNGQDNLPAGRLDLPGRASVVENAGIASVRKGSW